jgi:dTMP kinase
VPVLLTREPGGSPGAELLRGVLLSGAVAFAPLAETLLHFAARADHVAMTIRPALEAGMWVVCDRYYDSTMAYQGHAGGADLTAIRKLSEMLDCVPDLTLVLDVPVEVSLARLARRGTAADRYERLGAPFFAAIRTAFLDIASAEARCAVVDAGADEASVAAALWDAVRTRLP